MGKWREKEVGGGEVGGGGEAKMGKEVGDGGLSRGEGKRRGFHRGGPAVDLTRRAACG